MRERDLVKIQRELNKLHECYDEDEAAEYTFEGCQLDAGDQVEEMKKREELKAKTSILRKKWKEALYR